MSVDENSGLSFITRVRKFHFYLFMQLCFNLVQFLRSSSMFFSFIHHPISTLDLCITRIGRVFVIQLGIHRVSALFHVFLPCLWKKSCNSIHFFLLKNQWLKRSKSLALLSFQWKKDGRLFLFSKSSTWN